MSPGVTAPPIDVTVEGDIGGGDIPTVDGSGKSVIWISQVDSPAGAEFLDFLGQSQFGVTELLIQEPTADIAEAGRFNLTPVGGQAFLNAVLYMANLREDPPVVDPDLSITVARTETGVQIQLSGADSSISSSAPIWKTSPSPSSPWM